MNSQRLAQLRISPLRMQQGLFASLVLLLVMLATQQWQLHEQARDAAALRQALLTHSLSLRQVHEPIATASAQTHAHPLMPVDGVVSQDSQDPLPKQQRWVF